MVEIKYTLIKASLIILCILIVAYGCFSISYDLFYRSNEACQKSLEYTNKIYDCTGYDTGDFISCYCDEMIKEGNIYHRELYSQVFSIED